MAVRLLAAQPSTIPTLLLAGAGAAVPLVSNAECVRVIEGVSMNTVRLSRESGGQCFTAKEVDPTSHRLKMVGIHTRPVAADVIKFQPFRDRTNQQPIRNDVGMDVLIPLLQPERAIALVKPASRPHPALAGDINLRPETGDVFVVHSA